MKYPLALVALLFLQPFFAQENPTAEKTADSLSKIEEQKLKEVTVYGNRKQFLKIESDKTTVNVKNNPMLSTGNAFDVVKKLPGVITTPSGGLTLNAKGVTIYIDGAPSSLSGSDLENYLSSLPANAIEKVELIYSPGAAFEANASGSIINIVMSSTRLKGINASFNVNYNFNKYQKPSPQILLNGKEKNLSWQTMIGYNYIESESLQRNEQTFTALANQKLSQDNLSVFINRNFYFRSGTNYKLSKKSNLLFNYNLNAANDVSDFHATTFGENINYLNNGTTKTKNNNHEISLQYKTKLDTIGSTLDIIGFGNLFDRNPITRSDAFDNVTNLGSFNNADLDFKLKNYYIKYDFAFPFEKSKFSINTGGKFNVLQVNNLGKYFFNTPDLSTIDFDYSENNLAFYVEARKKINKFSFTAGLRFEEFKVERTALKEGNKIDINFTNSNFFPNLSAMYEITQDINISASYSKKINQPNYSSLDPNNGSSFDQYNASQGDPLLDPTFFDNYEFKISAMEFVQLGANYTTSKDNNLFVFSADADATAPVSNQTFQQFDRFSTFSAFLNFPIPLDYFLKGKEEFQKRMNTIDKMNYVYLSINYIKSYIDGYDFPYSNSAIMNYAAEAQFILPWGIRNSITYYILPSGNWQIYKVTKPIQQFDISFSKDFMNKKLRIGLHAFDLFNANNINALIAGQNLETTFYKKDDTRVFRFSLTYNFGNLKLEKENTNIQTEKVQSGGGILK